MTTDIAYAAYLLNKVFFSNPTHGVTKANLKRKLLTSNEVSKRPKINVAIESAGSDE